MNVVTLSKKALKDEVSSLYEHIDKDGLVPEIILGVATGGIYISRPIKEYFQANTWHGFYAEIQLSRHSTKLKKTINVKSILQKLPYCVLNPLRIFESSFFELTKPKQHHANKEKKVYLPDTLKEKIKKSKSLLLVDDAIDTGNTILSIKNAIQAINPHIVVKIAVLTVTHKRPYIEADYTNYKRTLLRCPWAEDYKGVDKIE